MLEEAKQEALATSSEAQRELSAVRKSLVGAYRRLSARDKVSRGC